MARIVIGVKSLTARHGRDLVCKSEFPAAVPPGTTEDDCGRRSDGKQAAAADAGGASELRGDRRGQELALRGGSRVGGRASGAHVRQLHGGSGGDGGVAEVVRRGRRRHGGDGRVLDSAFRRARQGGFRRASGQRAGDEAGQRSQKRRARLPVDPAADELRAAQGRVPAGGADLRAALLRAPARPGHRRPRALRAAHPQRRSPR